MDHTGEGSLHRRHNQPANSGWAGSKRDTEAEPATRRPGADVTESYVGIHPFNLPAKSAVLTGASNGCRERSNPSLPLHDGAAGPAYGDEGKDWPKS